MAPMSRSLAVLALCAGLGLAGGPAAARTAERIRSYDVDLRIESSGALQVSERIDYDFGATVRHGIFRDLPVRVRYDDRFDRLYRVKVVAVRGTRGTQAGYHLEGKGRTLRIRIGNPDRPISGRHGYTIEYRVDGALDGFPTRDELNWNAVGTGWTVPIERASAQVAVPVPVGHAACYAGPLGSRQACASHRVDGATALFDAANLAPHEGLAVLVGFATGAVPKPRPILDERWTFAGAFSVTPATAGTAAGLALVAVLAGTALLLLRGRARRTVRRTDVDTARTAISTPPDDLRPGLMGLLVDGVVHPVAIGATIVDLAARGYLRIEEVDRPDGDAPDWRFVKLNGPLAGLLPYESWLLVGLFRSAQGTPPTVTLSGLENFDSRYDGVRSEMYKEAMRRGWFVARPDKVRTAWILRGVGVLVLGVGFTVLVAALTHFGLVTLPIVLAGFALAVAAHWMPRRTPTGAALLERVSGFREHLNSAALASPADGEGGDLLPYLPYTLALGLTEQSAHGFDQQAGGFAVDWYRGAGTLSWDRLAGFAHDFRYVAGTDAVPAAAPAHSGRDSRGRPYRSDRRDEAGWWRSGGFSSGGGGGGGGGGGRGGGGGGGSW